MLRWSDVPSFEAAFTGDLRCGDLEMGLGIRCIPFSADGDLPSLPGRDAREEVAHILGMQLVKHYRFARAQYGDLRARGKRAADAFRRIIRSFSRILHAVIRDGKAFDEEVYIASLKRKGVKWALAL